MKKSLISMCLVSSFALLGCESSLKRSMSEASKETTKADFITSLSEAYEKRTSYNTVTIKYTNMRYEADNLFELIAHAITYHKVIFKIPDDFPTNHSEFKALLTDDGEGKYHLKKYDYFETRAIEQALYSVEFVKNNKIFVYGGNVKQINWFKEPGYKVIKTHFNSIPGEFDDETFSYTYTWNSDGLLTYYNDEPGRGISLKWSNT